MRYKNIKIILLGESGAGKTSLVNRLIWDRFEINPDITIGAAFFSIKLDSIKFDIWDTAGQERYLSLVNLYYRDTDIFLLLFDINNLETINRLYFYLDKISELDFNLNKILVLIIGNKLDLNKNYPENIIKNKLEKYKNFKLEYIYLSAKTGENFNLLNQKLINFGKNHNYLEPKNIKIINNHKKINFCCF